MSFLIIKTSLNNSLLTTLLFCLFYAQNWFDFQVQNPMERLKIVLESGVKNENGGFNYDLSSHY
jgi:hypothetical protein